MKSDFIALVSHELITPLTTINGGLELLLATPDEFSPTVQHRLGLLARETNRLTQLVRRILEVSRLEAGKLKPTFGPVALRPLLTRVVDALEDPAPPIQLHFEGPTPLLWGDELYIEEILRNLLHNAQQHTPPNTLIQVAVHPQEQENKVEITITDWGPGIPPEVQKHIFSAFYQVVKGEQRHSPGWGLGLYLTRRLVELHNGQLWVESPAFPSTERPSTRFHLVLPILSEDEPLEEETLHAAPADLIIDDDASLVELLESYFITQGFEVVTAGNGKEGLRRFYESRPDLIILDVTMPHMESWETLRRLRDLSDVPVIMLTVRNEETDVLRGFTLGADDYVTKPFPSPNWPPACGPCSTVWAPAAAPTRTSSPPGTWRST